MRADPTPNAMKKTKRLVLFGSREMATLARFYFERDSVYEVVAFTVDDANVETAELEGLPVIPWSEVTERFSPNDYEMFVALSYRGLNQLRAEKFAQAKAAGYRLARRPGIREPNAMVRASSHISSTIIRS